MEEGGAAESLGEEWATGVPRPASGQAGKQILQRCLNHLNPKVRFLFSPGGVGVVVHHNGCVTAHQETTPVDGGPRSRLSRIAFVTSRLDLATDRGSRGF